MLELLRTSALTVTAQQAKIDAVTKVLRSCVHMATDYERGRLDLALEIAKAMGGVEGVDVPTIDSQLFWEACHVNVAWSGTCVRGTRGCDVDHKVT